jgi:hypothetical protein
MLMFRPMHKGMPIDVAHVTPATGPDKPDWNNRISLTIDITVLTPVEVVQVYKATGSVSLARLYDVLHDEPFRKAVSCDVRRETPILNCCWWLPKCNVGYSKQRADFGLES